MYQIRFFSRDRLDDLFSLITANARTRWPGSTYLMTSDVAWRLPGSAPKENIRLWYDESGLAAYAWFTPGAACAFDIRCGLETDAPLFREIIDWLETRCAAFPPSNPWLLSVRSMDEWRQALDDDLPGKPVEGRVLQTSALDEDTQRRHALAAAGFTPTDHFEYSLTRDLDSEIAPPKVPEGFRLRHVEPADFDERVATHRDAWFKSTFSLEQYRRVRAIDIFEPELDIVAESDNRQFGAYCIGWLDRALGIGSFEPVGARPQFRRLGLAQAVTMEGLRRMKAMGMRHAKIGTASFNDPAYRLYVSCGFSLNDRNRTWVKSIGDSQEAGPLV